MPRQTVRPRLWDRHRRAEADAIDAQEAGWTVMYGPWSRAFWAFAQDPKPGEAYNLGGGKANAASLLECVELVAAASGGKRPVLTYDDQARVGDHICYYSDMGKFREHFPGWRQEYDVPAIVEEMVAAVGAQLG